MAKTNRLTSGTSSSGLKAAAREDVAHQWRPGAGRASGQPARAMAAGAGGDALSDAQAAIDEGRYADAQALARRVVNSDPMSADGWELLGRAHALWGQPDEAIAAFKSGITHRPNSAPMFSDLGYIYWSTGRTAAAAEALERAVALDGAEPFHRARLGLVRATQGRTAEAVQLLEKCAADAPQEQGIKDLLGGVYLEHGMRDWWADPKTQTRYCVSKPQLDEARACLEKARAVGSNDSDLVKEQAEQEVLLNRLAQREGEASWAAIILFGIFYIVPGVAWAYAHRRPRFLINRDYMEGMTGNKLSRLSLKLWRLVGKGYDIVDKTAGESSSWLWLVMMPIQAILLPAFFCLAVKENYLDVN